MSKTLPSFTFLTDFLEQPVFADPRYCTQKEYGSQKCRPALDPFKLTAIPNICFVEISFFSLVGCLRYQQNTVCVTVWGHFGSNLTVLLVPLKVSPVPRFLYLEAVKGWEKRKCNYVCSPYSSSKQLTHVRKHFRM